MRWAYTLRLDEEGRLAGAPMRWGWPDLWRGGPANRPKNMHARAETIDRLPTFAPSFSANRRGVLPMRSFNVGEEVGSRVVQHTLTTGDGTVLGGACVFDLVPDPDGTMVLAFVMVTTTPNQLMATVTDRMPALLRPEDWRTWLGEDRATASDAQAVLRPYVGELDMDLQQMPSSRTARTLDPDLLATITMRPTDLT